MVKKIISLIIILSLILILPSFALTGHINGCTNTGDPSTCCKMTFNIVPKAGYTIIDVIVNGISRGPITSYTFTNITERQTMQIITGEVTKWNRPKLATGLTPVNWSGSAWTTTDEANWDYNYNSVAEATHSSVAGTGDGKWANAQTADGSLYVWIPRYTYKITSGEHESGNSWNSLDAAGTNKIEIKFSNGTTDDTSDDYKAHPAFTFGTTELTGIWVAKYEASRNDATASSEGTGTTVSSKPGVVSLGNLTVSDMFYYAYNLNRSLESHLMKNTEWGAVAYLTNAIGRIPYINNSSSYITGNAGGSQDASHASGTTNAWNTAGGVKASTTHNVYGIYDLSGGAYEYVAAYLNNGSSLLSSYASNLVSSYSSYGSKYVDVYPIGTSDTHAKNYAAWSNITGDAVYETSNSESSSSGSWDGDRTYAPSLNPVFIRGGDFSGKSSSGLFNFSHADGDIDDMISLTSFRVSLAIADYSSAPASYSVAFNANGGSGTMNAQTFTAGVAQNLTANAFTRSGYTFKGWSTTSSGSVQYNDGASYTATGNATLYAVWELANAAPTTPTVTFSSKTTNSFKVTAKSTDAEGESLVYKLYVGSTLKATSASTASGTQVTLEAKSLSQYTSYNYYVTVTDGTSTTQSSTANVRTYCSGSGCTSLIYSDCQTCSGEGTLASRYSRYWASGCSDKVDSFDIEEAPYMGTSYVCGSCSSLALKGTATCKTCGITFDDISYCTNFESCNTSRYMYVWINGTGSYNYVEHNCPECDGWGRRNYCSTHSTSNDHCSHNQTSQHD